MKYRFIFTAWFDRNLKSLRKHNPSLRGDFESFLQAFDETHNMGHLYGDVLVLFVAAAVLAFLTPLNNSIAGS